MSKLARPPRITTNLWANEFMNGPEGLLSVDTGLDGTVIAQTRTIAFFQLTPVVRGEMQTATDDAINIEVIPPHEPQNDVEKLLWHVAHRHHSSVCAMIEDNPELLLTSGTVSDGSGRIFENVTAYQLALWGLDRQMWTMIRKKSPEDYQSEFVQQLQELEENGLSGGGTNHGKHYDPQRFIRGYEAYLSVFAEMESLGVYDWQMLDRLWIRKIGSAQRDLPMHAVNEFCYPGRALHPVPNFDETSPLPRSEEDNNGASWFTSEVGKSFAYCNCEYGFAKPVYHASAPHSLAAAKDLEAMTSLFDARLLDYENEKAEMLSPSLSPRRII